VRTTRFWNKIHQVHSNSKNLQKNNLQIFEDNCFFYFSSLISRQNQHLDKTISLLTMCPTKTHANYAGVYINKYRIVVLPQGHNLSIQL